MNSITYEEILRKQVQPFINRHEHPDDMVFQMDNASSHVSGYTREVMGQLGIEYVDWPSLSPT